MDREHTAILALHYQNEVLDSSGKVRLGFAEGDHRRGAMINAAQRLLSIGRGRLLPIIHVRIAFARGHHGVVTNAPIFRNVVEVGACEEGSWGTDFFPSLAPVAGEGVVTHSRINAFYESSLEMQLRRLRATRLIIGGVATNSVVEHSARHAADMGYQVLVAADACSAASDDVHNASLFNLRLVGTVTTVAALDQMNLP